LVTHARIVAAVIRPSRRLKQLPTLQMIAAAQTMVSLAEDVLGEVIAQARDEGSTWQQIGDALGTTRQAAFQRFGPGG
jgi:hypothetical protein